MTPSFTATRDQLVDAIAGLRADSVKPVNGVITLIAEDMADAIIEALADRWLHPDGTECVDPGDHKCSATWAGSRP